MIFSISPLNPVRYVPVMDFNPSLYWTKQFDDALQLCQTKFYNGKKPYYQKYTLSDTPVIQILSDYSDIVAEVFQEGSDVAVYTPVVNTVITSILDQTFSCYEFSLPWNVIGEGRFFTTIKYKLPEEPESAYRQYISEPLEIKEVHVGTLRFEYANSDNSFSMIFNAEVDPWVGILRLEGDINDFKPSSIDTIYPDEIHNVSMVMSRPFRQFTLSIGEGDETRVFEGLPDWVVDKVNRVLSCDQVKIDGKYFCKSEGAQWEKASPDDYQFSGQRITISESQNNFQLNFDIENPNELMVPIQKILSYPNNTANIIIPNVFKKNTLLEKICIINSAGGAFEIAISTSTTGGDDDIDPPITEIIDNLTTTIVINQLFGTDKVVNISGLTDNTTTIWVVYKKLDAPTTGSSNPYQANGKNFMGFYYEMNEGEFEVDFDMGTRRGQDGTAWAGWAICNGENNTPDMRGLFILGNDGITNQTLEPAGQTGGSFKKQILISNLPIMNFKLFGKKTNPATNGGLEPYIEAGPGDYIAAQGGQIGYDQVRVGKSPNIPTIGVTNSIGGTNGDGTNADPSLIPLANFDITPPFRRVIVVMKIEETV